MASCAVALVVFGASQGQTQQVQQDAVLSPPPSYNANCAQCHGARGEGARGPALYGSALQHGSDAESVAASIRHGYPATGMPGFGELLSEAEIGEIVAFLAEQDAPANDQLAAQSPDKFFLPTEPVLLEGVVQSAVESFRIEMVARVEQPYGMAFLPDGRLLVTEGAPGRLRIIEAGTLLPDAVEGTPFGPAPRDFFKRRLLDVAGHPTNGWIYLTSAEAIEGETQPGKAVLSLSRGHISDNRWVDAQILLQIPTPESAGARIAFDRQGRVHLGTVHAPSQAGAALSTPQDLSSPHGKILRLMPDGSVPPDNPFLDREGAFPYVWAYGLRSPLGLAFDDRGRL